MKDKIIQFFSNLGRSLMMPIAALAACGIVLGLTSALLKAQVVAAVPFLGFAVVKFVILALNQYFLLHLICRRIQLFYKYLFQILLKFWL